MGKLVSVKQKGDLSKTYNFLNRDRDALIYNILNQYALIGLNQLAQATPVRTGKTANSWGYEISKTNHGWQVAWTNSNMNEGVSIVMLIRYGHGTKSGGYVQPNDFVSPAMKPIFDSIADEAWREVTANAN